MSQATEKREIPTALRKCLAVDAYLTDVFVKTVERFLPLRQLKVHYRVLEYSCHGVPWIAGWLAFIWILNNRNFYQVQVNLMIGLVIDIIVIALLKAVTRRRRPAVNDDPFAIGPDKYAFPSGHASRASLIVYFFLYLSPVPIIFIPPLLAWLTSICLSRLLMRRHHLLDVITGIAIGIVEGLFVSFIYLDPETSANVICWITDEKTDGGEYHV